MPPFGHSTQLRVFVDPDLLQYDEVWAVRERGTTTSAPHLQTSFVLQAAADFAEVDDALLEDFIPRLRKLNARGAKSVSNRCKKIAKQLGIEL